ncbi:unnamed protein product [Penicillium egyptiacum]|uniref:succinate-semialdehyde dehydrogenase [NAD(P)(+)] n=1 Tax=Penicillium egyptiacum TaxID=1303716 RepID=A0A9W4P9Q0_9EURO|nr:unnamed protein product [Penicillium egyptiacum]
MPDVAFSQKVIEAVTENIIAIKNLELFVQDQALIDGCWIKRKETFKVYEPSTAQVLRTVANCDLKDVHSAIESANVARKKYYSSTTAAQRGSLLRKWHNLVIENVEDLGRILYLENGKTINEARGEVAYAASFITWFTEEATRSYSDTIPSSTPNTVVMTMKEPVSVCGIVTLWNFPAAIISRKVAPALAVRCSVVIKPPSETPFTCLALTKLAIKAGFPGEVIQVCPTKNRQVASELATHPLIRKISFTRSTNVGKNLAKIASRTLKKVSLELGANAPFIVFEDADVDLAIEGAMLCKFRCSGQTYTCANRIYVQRGILDEFTQRLVQKASELRLGPGIEESYTQGPLVNASAVDKVKRHIEDAVSKGASIEIGGSAPEVDRFFIQPTVLSGVTADMVVSQDKTFGPLAPIFPFDTKHKVVELANKTEFGLARYFFSRKVGRVMHARGTRA